MSLAPICRAIDVKKVLEGLKKHPGAFFALMRKYSYATFRNFVFSHMRAFALGQWKLFKKRAMAGLCECYKFLSSIFSERL